MDNFIVSARKYRPATFDTVIGQKGLTTTLKNAIRENKLAHAYLFCGPRGVGKTTCARIFAKTINCEHLTADGEACNECESCRAFNEGRSYSIHELDAASNNSVEDIRGLIEQVRIPPQVGSYKVFIIDEVHMLSTSAFNAFLKTLEEPPAYAKFILATTERHKVLPTIISRCQVYDFYRIGIEDIVEHLRNVASKEGVTTEDDALTVIAQKADGGMRDALSLFDQMVSYTQGNVTYKGVIDNLNILDYDYFFRLTDYVLENKVTDCMVLLNEVLLRGFDGGNFIGSLASHMRDLLMSSEAATLPLLDVSADMRARYQQQAQKCTAKFLYRAIKLCNDCDLNYRVAKNKRLIVELTLIQLAQLTQDDDDGSAARRPRRLKSLFGTASAAIPTARTNNSTPSQRPAPRRETAADAINASAPTRPTDSATTAAAPSSTASPAAGYAPAVAPTGGAASIASPTPSATGSTRTARTMGRGGLGTISLNSILGPAPQPKAEETAATVSTAAEAAPASTSTFTEDALTIAWNEFILSMPHDEVALAERMKCLRPTLGDDKRSLSVTLSNRLLEKDLKAIQPRIEEHMAQKAGIAGFKMEIVFEATNEDSHIATPYEQYQKLVRENTGIGKLVKELNLDLI